MESETMKLDPRLSLTGQPTADPIKKADAKSVDGGQVQSKSQESSTRLREDTVTLSSSAADVQRLTASLNDVPEVRSDRVQALQQRIQTGNYAVDREKLADALIGEQPRLNVKA
jgi:negative regulator of flagellin synthesis FlgM